MHLFLLFGLLAWWGGVGSPAQPPPTGAYAIVGARIEIGDGRTVAKGTVVLREGMIVAVGPEVAVPADAEVISGAGLVVYPGFVDAGTSQGLKLPEATPTQDTAPDTTAEAPASMREGNRKGVRPELRAADCLLPTDAFFGNARQAGFTTALLLPGEGTITGMGALVNLTGRPKRESVVRPEVGMGFTFRTSGEGGFGGGGGYPGNLLGIIALTRQTLLDAQHYRALQTAFEKGGSQRPPVDDSLRALQPVLRGEIPALFEADSEKQIVRALRLAEEFGLRPVIYGGTEAGKAASRLVTRKIPVLLSLNFEETGGRRGRGGPPAARNRPTPSGTNPNTPPPAEQAASRPTAGPEEDPDLPKAVQEDRKRQTEERVANAAEFHKAGGLFAFTTRGLRTPAEFWRNLRRAIAAGLPKEVALRALTLVPAQIFGMERQLGTVEAGKIAALVLLTGDFTDEKAKVKYLFIDRDKFAY